MIKVISFDIGGTLIKSEAADNYNLKALAKLVDKDYESVRKAYKNIFQRKEGTFEELVNEFGKALEIDINKDINNFFKKKFVSQKNNISKENIRLIKSLKKMGYKVILFSNTCCLMNNYIEPELKRILDGVFYSFNIGYTKSDKESYRYIEKQLGNLPSEFLHIGDTMKSDYLNPINNGWKALYYGNTDNSNIKSIHNLVEVVNYL